MTIDSSIGTLVPRWPLILPVVTQRATRARARRGTLTRHTRAAPVNPWRDNQSPQPEAAALG